MDKHLVLAHELDAAWIIGLWLAIHGGDPSPIELSAEAVERVVESVLTATHATKEVQARPVSFEHLQSTLKAMNIEVTRGTGAAGVRAEAATTESHANRERQYCFKYKGNTYCITLPSVKGPPPR